MVKTILDLTYPITSMFSGTGFNSSISSIFRDRQIEVCSRHTWLAVVLSDPDTILLSPRSSVPWRPCQCGTWNS